MRLVLIALLLALALAAQNKMSVAQLKAFIESSIKLKHDDRKVAEILKKVQLTGRLDFATVEDLQGLGAGPKTVDELKKLVEVSGKQPVEPPPPTKPVYVPPPPPDAIEQKRILSEITEYARNYTARMPDFICTQVTRRSVDPTGMEFWQKRDTIVERLTFFEKHEDYKVELINNTPVSNLAHEKLGGTVSSGEYASLMREIFDAYTQTDFEWERWATFNGRRTHVFSFKVSQGRSQYSISADGAERIITGYHGQIFVDRDRLVISRITMQSDELPVGYPVREVNLTIDYEMTKIADREYMLPLKVTVKSRMAPKLLTRNEVEFHLYRKFTAESEIKAFEPEPIPDSVIKDTAPPDKKP